MGEQEIAVLRYQFRSQKIKALFTDEKGAKKYPSEVVTAFFEVMAVIDAALDLRDFYALKSLHFEKLGGNRKGEYSMRLNRQWRLTLTIEQDEEGNYLLIIDIEDYHR